MLFTFLKKHIQTALRIRIRSDPYNLPDPDPKFSSWKLVQIRSELLPPRRYIYILEVNLHFRGLATSTRYNYFYYVQYIYTYEV
jgi:hypothetical protein